MAFLAHSENESGQPQLLVDHLRAVAQMAATHARPFDGFDIAYWAGLWHDIGKFNPEFQEYLGEPGRKRGPDHSSAGAVMAESFLQPAAPLIAGHHGGLPSLTDLRERLEAKRDDAAVQDAIASARNAITDVEPGSGPNALLPAWLSGQDDGAGHPDERKRRLEVFLRFAFSSLVDADFLDTEAHFDADRARARPASADTELERLWTAFRDAHEALRGQARETEVNRLRHAIYEHCLRAAGEAPGFFRLAVPTGGGKTLSGMAFALQHALGHGLRRIIVAIPYTSIIEQTAMEYRKIFGTAVLEHHSAVHDPGDRSPVTYRQSWARLAAENWDAPVIVTTNVQLFESLFSNRTGATRKLHNIARSVIILDEVQTLPPGLLEPVLDMLRELVGHYGVTVVLSTATQPAVSQPPYSHLFRDARDIVPEPEQYFRALSRVRYDIPALEAPWDWERVAREMEGEERALAILNTKADAAALWRALDDPAAMHLSTNMCAAHRGVVLDRVKERHTQEKPCRLVSTQVVEAGVDLDFPLVLRALGPLDRIVQAAGRCNREGRLGLRGGRVVVFEPADGGSPRGAYATGIGVARGLLNRGADLDDPATHRRYFERLSVSVELDHKGIQPLRAAMDYPEVAHRFRLIDDETVPTVVDYGPALDAILALLENVERARGEPRTQFRALQPYVVNLRRWFADRALANGDAVEVTPGLLRWRGRYHDVLGLVPDGEWRSDELMV